MPPKLKLNILQLWRLKNVFTTSYGNFQKYKYNINMYCIFSWCLEAHVDLLFHFASDKTFSSKYRQN